MIKVYKIKIDNKVYEVELESVTEKDGVISVCNDTPLEKKDNFEKTESAGGIAVEAPMQGLVLDIFVSVGDTVSEGEELIVLEAMKMQTPIVAPLAGRIKTISVLKGENVETGKVLLTLE
ncbi:biotin/lipoyl-containing protein [Treponema pedis]|uniref:biotin/lipoyl-containing protein n=1 Tax=Treponema pedis TaxID=409322 RepID=UPI0004212ACB|nr:biotin/lipoyl-containing protein [Treponema pedis]QSI04335.1 acetyl-CoA carboxylase biotin carboxyl carrier protein subunit [Treponema pedis]